MVNPDVPKDLNDLAAFTSAGQAGEFIFREGDTSTELYFIQEGQIEILKQYPADLRQIAVLEAGDFFGEVSLLEGQPREISARAISECRLLRLDPASFDQILQEEPGIALRMLRRVAVHLTEQRNADVRAAKVERASSREDTPTPIIGGPRKVPSRAVLFEPVSATEFDVTERTESAVGRIDRATGFRPEIDLTDLDTKRTLSRRHARILKRGDDFYVCEEKGAHNGTFVNGERLATGAEAKLVDGARVRFGLVELVFRRR
jgi:hypothetical protein